MKDGDSFFYGVCYDGYISIVKVLFNKGVYINLNNIRELSFFFIVFYGRYYKIV